MAGDLKLAYAQFEELETFARFGARLDEDTRKIIEHGRRIRACLKQPEFAPVSVAAQIALLLALTAKLFDGVPLDRMLDAEQAVQGAAAGIPAEACVRLDTADKLSDEDRDTFIEIARKALEAFSPKPESKSKQEQGTQDQPKPEAKAEPKSDPKLNESTPGSESAAEHKGNERPEYEAKSESNIEPKPQSKREAKPELERKAQEDAQQQAVTEPKSKPMAMPDESTAGSESKAPFKEKS